MKKYKTWEAIKMLTENSKLKFKLVDGRHPNSYLMAISKEFKNGYICYADETRYPVSAVGEISIKDEWELVQQEVPFIEAIKAHQSGKTIYCLIDKHRNTYKPRYSLIDDENKKSLADIEILCGHWYIKED